MKVVLKSLWFYFVCLPIALLAQQPTPIGTGTGFFISQDGYIATNHHVVKDGVDFGIIGINGDFNTVHYAKVVAKDRNNDLAILKVDVKINDPIPFSFREDLDIGSDLYTIGFPLGYSLSKNPKPSDGILSDKQGEAGELNQYLYTIKTEPGNSGSPVFDMSTGDVIAVHAAALGLSAKHSYNKGIKISFLKNLVKSNSLPIDMNLSKNQLQGKSLPEQIKIVRNHIVLVEVYTIHHNAMQHKLDDLLAQADNYYNQQNYSQAYRAYIGVLKLSPNNKHANNRINTITKMVDQLFTDLLALADESMRNRQYTQAIDYLEQANSIYPNDPRVKNKLAEYNTVIEREFKKVLNEADYAFQNKRYDNAKTLYQKALTIIPDDWRATKKLREINELVPFLRNRTRTTYDYKIENSYSYRNISTQIVNNAKRDIERLSLSGIAKVELKFVVDTFGVTNFSINNLNSASSVMIDLLNNIAQNIKLKPTKKYDYPINAEAKYIINIDINEQVVSAQKKETGLAIDLENANTNTRIIESLLSKQPIGSYQIKLRNGTVNNQKIADNKIIKYKGLGGPGNGLKSLLIPGLGVKSVTGGEETGLRRMGYTYLLISSGIGCKIYSNNQYKKYQTATDQESIDEFYENANNFHKGFYGLLAAGALVWTYDIIWVTRRGLKNKKDQRNFNKTLSLNLRPSGSGLSLIYNF